MLALRKKWPELTDVQELQIQKYCALLVEENERQNLTRLVSEDDLINGHLLHVRELLKLELRGPFMDLGSGGGIPGVPAALVGGQKWILAESETAKAEFLERAVVVLGAENISVHPGRGEDYLLRHRVETVVCRAIGPVDRIWKWIGKCSTWNTLVLFKARGWDSEWARHERALSKHLSIRSDHRYLIEDIEFRIVILEKTSVPRGTL